jgi:hypothetical protein
MKKTKKFKLNIEEEVISRSAKELAARIDFSVLAGLLKDSGWIHVKLLHDEAAEVEVWVKQNVKGHYNHYDNE